MSPRDAPLIKYGVRFERALTSHIIPNQQQRTQKQTKRPYPRQGWKYHMCTVISDDYAISTTVMRLTSLINLHWNTQVSPKGRVHQVMRSSRTSRISQSRSGRALIQESEVPHFKIDILTKDVPSSGQTHVRYSVAV
jgi:hypothetical protein